MGGYFDSMIEGYCLDSNPGKIRWKKFNILIVCLSQEETDNWDIVSSNPYTA